MGNPFFDAFDASLCEAERVMGEEWSFNGNEYKAIEVDPVTTEMQAMPGGKFRNLSVVVHVRLEVFTSSGVADGSILLVRGDKVRVNRIEKDGDAARVLFCGPAQINTGGLL
jgi:hypothetical protein